MVSFIRPSDTSDTSDTESLCGDGFKLPRARIQPVTAALSVFIHYSLYYKIGVIGVTNKLYANGGAAFRQ